MIATWKNVPKSFEGFGFMAYQQGKATPKKFVIKAWANMKCELR
jgi:hypothetical protein